MLVCSVVSIFCRAVSEKRKRHFNEMAIFGRARWRITAIAKRMGHFIFHKTIL